MNGRLFFVCVVSVCPSASVSVCSIVAVSMVLFLTVLPVFLLVYQLKKMVQWIQSLAGSE